MITLTTNAIEQIKKFREEAKMPSGGLRIAVVGGGCSGLSYKLDFEKESRPDDKVFEQEGVKVFVDPKSFLYLNGLEVDYKGGLTGSGFTFNNPNAQKGCGCGSSFSP
ncbi:MAG: iron-sulfur cluster assembly accessory protein [Deltaproteobacteria bacterium]|nr:iron-sulfur cluster assembly accessory protein [Deltaproteobacteria bacterium]